MKTFFESSATKAVLFYLMLQLLMALSPMMESHEIDPWALGKAVIGAAVVLVGNALRSDVNAPGFNWLFGPKDPQP